MTKIQLFHGSSVPVFHPRLFKQYRHDFGDGFYLTTDYQQAKKWAQHKAKDNATFYVSCYTIDKRNLNYLKIKQFKTPNENWLNFIVQCRKFNYEPNNDLIIGPVMDGQYSWLTLELYLQHKLSFSEAIDGLKVYHLTDQWAFKTERALSFLNLKQVIKYG